MASIDHAQVPGDGATGAVPACRDDDPRGRIGDGTNDAPSPVSGEGAFTGGDLCDGADAMYVKRVELSVGTVRAAEQALMGTGIVVRARCWR